MPPHPNAGRVLSPKLGKGRIQEIRQAVEAGANLAKRGDQVHVEFGASC